MKSFFKKLAFVMAMAMVVSLAAPAAANAATVLQAAHQESKEVVTVLPMEVNEEVDLCFLGAPEGWRQLERQWTTSDEKVVAKVNEDGLFKAVAPGTATIKFEMEGCEPAVVEVVVKAPVVAEEFDVTQKSGSALDINFAGETSYDVKDVTLYIVYENASNPEKPIEIKWPIDTENSKKNGNVITITPFVALGDGDNYKVVVGNYEDTITTKIGAITHIEITPAKNEVYTETPVKVTPKLLSNGVDLTDRYLNTLEIEYTVQVVAGTDDDLDYADDENYVLEVEFFEKDMVIAVTAVVKNSKNEVLATSDPVGIKSAAKPAWSFDGAVVDWALIHEDATVVDWSKKSVPADKSNAGEYSIVLKFQDSEDKTYVTAPNAIRDKGSNKDNHTYINGSTDAISAAKYAVYFYSANEEVMLVDEETGEIGVYTPATGVFYIGLEYYGGEEEVLKYIYAGEVVIDNATKLDEVYPKKDTANVTKLTEGDFVKKAEVELVAEDQYNDPWAGVAYTAYFLGANNAKVALDATCFTDKAGFISLEGADFAAANDSVERVYIEATSTDPLNPVKLTTYIDVTITAPKTDDNGAIVYDTVVKNRYATYPVIALDKDVKYDLKDTTASGTVIAEIDLYKTSNGAQVGYYDAAEFETPATEDEIKALTAEGTKYVVVRDPSKKIVALNDDLSFALNTVNGNSVTYAAKGTYTVEVVTVRYNSRNGNQNNYVVTSTIEVDNTAKTVTFDGKKSNTFSADCLVTEGNVTTIDVKDVVVETMKFKLGNDAWAITADKILDVKAVVLDNAVIIQWVKVKVPVAGDMYVEKTIIPSTVVSVKLENAQ